MKLEQLLEDPTFMNWASQADKKDFEKWQSLHEQHPEYAGLMEETRLMLISINPHREKLSEADKAGEWQKLHDRLNLPREPVKAQSIPRQRWWLVAASVGILVVAGWSLSRYFLSPEPVVARSAYGEIKMVELPDGSSVTLNANSKLTYPESWKAGKDMEVELEGEAFFNVEKKKQSSPFTVLAAGSAVEVLGTRFNVNARQEVAVSLVEGKVRMWRPGTSTTVTLEPGQSARYDQESGAFLLLEGLTELAVSWTEGIWSFRKTPLPEVLQRISDEYGMTCVLKDPGLADRRVSGKVSVDDREVLFRALSALLDIEIKESDGQLVFSLNRN